MDTRNSNTLEFEQHHINRLNKALQVSYEGIEIFQEWIKTEMLSLGMEIDEFKVDISELTDQPGYQRTLRENPGQLLKARNVIGKIPGTKPRHGILLFGHADKRPETYEWAELHAGMETRDGRFYGPGIADDVSGLTAIISAVETFLNTGAKPIGDLIVASILGKQGGIFGTYGLMKRYGPLDSAVYVHPAESGKGLGDLKIASLGCIEFSITIDGKGPDTTESLEAIFSKTAISATDLGYYITSGLQKWAEQQSLRYYHKQIQELTGQSFSLLIGKFVSGFQTEVYKIPRKCRIDGVVCFPSNARLNIVREDFIKTFDKLVNQDKWLSQGNAKLEWGDIIDESCQSDENHPFLKTASDTIKKTTGKNPSMYYGHTTSDIRYPLLYWKAQAFGLGPLAGDLGKETEWVDKKEYLETIMSVSNLLHSI